MLKPTIKTAALLLCAALIMCGCGSNQAPEATLRYDLSDAPGTLDPQYADSPGELEVIANSFEGLTAISGEGKAVPACAESWSVTNGGRTYTFVLRDDIRWANGDKVTAADFAFGIKRLFNPAAFSPAAESFLMIKNAGDILYEGRSSESLGVSAKSERELVITLEYDDPSLLTVLASAAASPCQQKFFEEQRGRYGLEAQNIMCNGPFVVSSWGDTLITMAKNSQYRREIAIDGVNLYINRGDSLKRFIEGRSDVFLVPFYRLGETEGLSGETYYDQSWVMILNYQNEVLSSKAVRASLIAALDLDERLSELPGYLNRYHGMIAPDAVLAGSLYREFVGLPEAADLPEDVRGSFLSALNEMGKNDVGRMAVSVSAFEPGPQLGGAFQMLWQQKLSAFVNMEQLEYRQLLDRVASGDFDIAVAPLLTNSQSPVDCLSLFEALSGEPTGQISEMLSVARRQTDAQKAAEQLLAAEQYLIDEYVVVPLFSAPSLFVTGEGVSGVYYNSINRTVYFADAVCQRE